MTALMSLLDETKLYLHTFRNQFLLPKKKFLVENLKSKSLFRSNPSLIVMSSTCFYVPAFSIPDLLQ